jgi:replication-associated recombination protein RarA
MMNRANTTTPLTVPSEELETAVDTIVALCEGDQRAALRALAATTDYLNAEVERLQEMISTGLLVQDPARRNRGASASTVVPLC